MLRKLEYVLFWILAVTIPVQARIILYQHDWFFNEYTARALYATDIAATALLALWVLRSVRERKGLSTGVDLAWAVFIVCAAVISMHDALEPGIALYRIIKLAEGMLLYLYVRSVGVSSVLPAFVAGGILQSVIALAQYVRQSDLGLQIFGESVLAPSMRGVAAFLNEGGEKIIRGYGLAPHPNVLASYLLVALFAWCILFFRRPWKHQWLWLLSYGILLWGFLATYARITIGVALLGALTMLMLVALRKLVIDRQRLRAVLIVTVIAVAAFGGLFCQDVIGRFTIAQGDEAIVLRSYYNRQALHSASGLNITGVGIGNFVPWLMATAPGFDRGLYQPAHNLFLLIYAEIGILGLAGVVGSLVWIGSAAWRHQRILLVPLGVFLLIAGFDHFFWTLQQGILLWWLVLGAIAHHAKSR